MEPFKIVIGPNDVVGLIAEAGISKVHRVQIEFDIDANGIVKGSVHYYPVDKKLAKIKKDDGSVMSRDGCPYPPDCQGVGLLEAVPQECVDKIESESRGLN